LSGGLQPDYILIGTLSILTVGGTAWTSAFK
jgi:hypothetical protein